MSSSWVHFIPIVTTLLAIPFSIEIFRRYRQHPERLHLLWWSIGVATYGVGTFTEASTTLFGWHEQIFRAWYVSGALLGGAPLAQGTVYLMLPRKAAHALTTLLIVYVVLASVAVYLSPIDLAQVETHRLSGKVFEWQWVRMFSPLVNLYAMVFLIGGAIAVVLAGVTHYAGAGEVLPFVCSAVAVTLLASLVGRSVEQLGDRFGPGATGVLQSALGNLPELFIALFALKAGLVAVVQAARIGSILANLLLVLGMCFVVGGLKHGPQKLDSQRARQITVLMVLPVAAMVIPSIAH